MMKMHLHFVHKEVNFVPYLDVVTYKTKQESAA